MRKSMQKLFWHLSKPDEQDTKRHCIPVNLHALYFPNEPKPSLNDEKQEGLHPIRPQRLRAESMNIEVETAPPNAKRRAKKKTKSISGGARTRSLWMTR